MSIGIFCRDRMRDKSGGMSLRISVHWLTGRCCNLTSKSSGIGIGEGRWEREEWWGRSFHQSHTQINESGNREQSQRRWKDSEERDRRWMWNEKRKKDRDLSVYIWVLLYGHWLIQVMFIHILFQFNFIWFYFMNKFKTHHFSKKWFPDLPTLTDNYSNKYIRHK